MSPLTYIFGWPLLMALVLMAVPRENRAVFRWGSILATLGSFVLALFVFVKFDPATDLTSINRGYAFVQTAEWIPSLGINFHIGVDGVSVLLVLMGALVSFAAACCAGGIKAREKEFAILLLMMTGGILGAFMALDIFLMYFLHELALIPTFIMIGIWGRGENREIAAYKITLYLSLGALLALVGLIMIYLHYQTFNLPEIIHRVQSDMPDLMTTGQQGLVFALLMFGLGILVGLWPFHTWAPLAYGAAPTATAMMHAGVIKKFGLFMLLRVALPILPDGAQQWLPVLAWLCLGNLLYCGLVAMRQRDLNQLLGNASVAHMGFVFLGIASMSLIGLTGAVMVMVAHGLLAALAFALSGHLHQQARTLDMDKLGGLLTVMPFWGTLLLMALLAGCGLPGFANFAGEITVFFGAWKTMPLITGIAAWAALVVGAVYMLRAARQLLHGPRAEDAPHTDDIPGWQKLPFALLLGALLLFGFAPTFLTNKIESARESLVTIVEGYHKK